MVRRALHGARMSAGTSGSAGPWSTLVRTAIVGTQREAAPALYLGDDAFETLLAPRAGVTPEAEVLRAAAVLGLARRAGAHGLNLEQIELDPAPPETLARCGPEAALDLMRLFSGGPEAALLPEWLALAANSGQRVPEELLPQLLSLGAARRELRAAIAPVIGERGVWLAAQRPEWSYASGADDALRAWHDADRAGRVRALVALRSRSPDDARELLAAGWEQELPAERAAFVEALRTGLSAGDEPFLETTLDERRKDVRTAAAALLVRLPQSRLAQRAVARADVLVSLARHTLGGPVLTVVLPVDCDPLMQRDGIEPRPPAGVGERAWWLEQIIAAVPPAHWSAAHGLSAGEMLAFAAQSDVADGLLRGLARATASYGDDRWRCAWAENPAAEPPIRARALSRDDDAAATSAYVAAVTRSLDTNAEHAADLPATVPGPWDAAFSRSVVCFIRRIAGVPGDWATWSARRELLALAAARVEPELPDLAEGWPENVAEERVRTAIAGFCETVRFRAAMRAHLKAGR
jgi:hypothetical protein